MPIAEILSKDQKRKRVWKRIQYLLSVLILVALLIFITNEYRSGYMSKHQDWIEGYGEQLINNYDSVLVASLKQEKQDSTNLILETLRSQPVVIEASLFDISGVPISIQSEMPTAEILFHYSSSSPQLFVRELRSKDTNLGFLRVTIDRRFLLRQNAQISQSKWYLMAILSVISVLIGMSLGIRFANWRHSRKGFLTKRVQ